MPSEWAIQEARRFTEKWKLIRYTLPIAQMLDASRAQGRREGLEKAEKAAAKGSEHKCGSLWCNDAAAHAKGDVAAEIRALIDKEPQA
jgi:hypothetical protein